MNEERIQLLLKASEGCVRQQERARAIVGTDLNSQIILLGSIAEALWTIATELVFRNIRELETSARRLQ